MKRYLILFFCSITFIFITQLHLGDDNSFVWIACRPCTLKTKWTNGSIHRYSGFGMYLFPPFKEGKICMRCSGANDGSITHSFVQRIVCFFENKLDEDKAPSIDRPINIMEYTAIEVEP